MAETQKIRAATRDVAFTYKMPAGFPGDVNRIHPASITAEFNDATYPVAAYGYPLTVNAAGTGVRGFIAADTALTKIHAVAVRPYPAQSTATAFGTGGPAAGAVIDGVRSGFVFASLPSGSAAPVKEGAVYVWIAATSGAHIQGGFESAASSGNTIAITNARFVGGMDSSGVAEIEVFRA